MERKGSERTKISSDAKGTASSSSSKDIWMMFASMEPKDKQSQLQPEELTSASTTTTNLAEERDTFTLIVGSKSAGKTSLISNFRSSTKAEEIKPTTALDYVFVRLKASSASARPPVAHIWELASLKCVKELIRVPLSPERILNGALIIVLDLSVPGDVVPYLVKWLITLYRVVQDVLKQKEKNPVDNFAVDKLRQDALVTRYGTSHPDRDEVTPIPLPVLIVANKYDTFRDEDSVKRKGITQAVRYLAHMYGASLLFTSMKDKNLVTQFRSVMKNFAFRVGGMKGSKEVDSTKPLFVPAGSDLFEDIGMPKTARRQEFTKEQHEERAKQWKKIATEYYAPTGEVTEANDDKADVADGKDGGDDKQEQYPEPNIDRVRQRKSEELRRYREKRKSTVDKRSKGS